jgi:putative glutamine amidotransferase
VTARRPVIGITTDIVSAATPTGTRLKADVGLAYALCVQKAGGTPVLLPAIPECVSEHLDLCDGFVFTGGDDPRTEEFGQPTDPRVKPMHPQRQAYELALLRALEAKRETPVLGICLGMQLMSLVHGGRLDQYMPDSRPDAARHWDAEHEIVLVPGSSALRADSSAASHDHPKPMVASKHKQAIIDPGRLQILAHSDDGVIEAVGDPSRRFYLGVQWHPERTDSAAVGQRIFDELLRPIT